MILIQDGNYLENLSRDKIVEVLLISLICILIVFLILTLIIGVCSLSTKGVEVVNAKTHINPKEENKILEEDEDAVAASLVATIEFNKETDKNARLKSIKRIDDWGVLWKFTKLKLMENLIKLN